MQQQNKSCKTRQEGPPTTVLEVKCNVTHNGTASNLQHLPMQYSTYMTVRQTAEELKEKKLNRNKQKQIYGMCKHGNDA